MTIIIHLKLMHFVSAAVAFEQLEFWNVECGVSVLSHTMGDALKLTIMQKKSFTTVTELSFALNY